MRTLHRFHGGVHPPDHKTESTGAPIRQAPVPDRLVLPLHQHIGSRAKPLVKRGDRVLKGQMIGAADGAVSSALHAPTSGKVTAVDMEVVAHPSGLPDLCVTIEPDGDDRWIEHQGLDCRSIEPSALRELLRDAGVVGLGGAVFPSFVKLDPAPGRKIGTLIINGAECEPWITCDDLLMRERAEEIVRGIELLRFMLGAEEVLIGIENNKPEAIATMGRTAGTCGFEVIPVPSIYPGGGEKQLIMTLTGKEVPSGKRPYEIGIACFNVATAYTIYRALTFGEPVVSRLVTVTGNVNRAGNFEVLIGTPVEQLVALAEPLRDTNGYLMGGPMMGVALPSTRVPVVKATNCIIATSPKLFPANPAAMPCIRCGKCAEACPAELQPMDLYWFARAGNLGKAQEYSLFDCIECGCCNYVCPSHIPLVQYYRYAKSEIWAHEQEKQASELARRRHEFRKLRMERDKQEKAEKLAQKSAALKASAAPAGETAADPKKAAIQAAIERAKAAKAGIAPKNIDNLPPEKRAEIAEIEKRRATIREMAKNRIED